MITGFNHFNLTAERRLLDELREFYIEIVGLEPGARPPFTKFGYWLYAGGQPVLHLTEALPHEAPHLNTVSTFNHAAFSCTDLDEVTARLLTHGIAHQLGDVPQSGGRQLFFRDPAGNGVELHSPPEPATEVIVE